MFPSYRNQSVHLQTGFYMMQILVIKGLKILLTAHVFSSVQNIVWIVVTILSKLLLIELSSALMNDFN